MKEVVIESKMDGRRWLFECNRWLDKKEDDGKLERELIAIGKLDGYTRLQYVAMVTEYFLPSLKNNLATMT